MKAWESVAAVRVTSVTVVVTVSTRPLPTSVSEATENVEKLPGNLSPDDIIRYVSKKCCTNKVILN